MRRPRPLQPSCMAHVTRRPVVLATRRTRLGSAIIYMVSFVVIAVMSLPASSFELMYTSLLSSLKYGVTAIVPQHRFDRRHSTTIGGSSLFSRRNRNRPDDYDYNDDFLDDDEEFVPRDFDDLGEYRSGQQDGGFNVPSSFGRRAGWRLPEAVSKSLLAGVFVLGVGLGVTIDSQVNTNPKDLASRDAIDQAAPNPTLCAEMGASAMAFDQRVFVSFNPFNVYVSQADVKPACVLREANIVPILRERRLINDDEVRSCKRNMNTWAFVGDLDNKPQLSCVYRSQDAQNEFLSNPKIGIGEDYLDDDRAGEATGKIVKGALTKGQMEGLADRAKIQRQLVTP